MPASRVKFSRIWSALEIQSRELSISGDPPSSSWGEPGEPALVDWKLCEAGQWRLPSPFTENAGLVGVITEDGGLQDGFQIRARLTLYRGLRVVIAWEEEDGEGTTVQSATIPAGGGWSDWISATVNKLPIDPRVYCGQYLNLVS